MHAPSAFRGFRSALAARDPDFDGLRRAARAGLGVPASAALGFSLGHGQGPLFAIFGATAMLIMVDFPGTPARRAVSYAGLTLSGAALIVLGTLVAPYPWAAVATTFAVGATATFSGVLSSSAAAAKRAILVPFVFPACTPPGPVGDRLGGWLIAAAVCIPAAVWVFPPRHHDELRRRCGQVASALADRLAGQGSARAVNNAMNGLFAHYVDSEYRPVGLTAGSRALVRVVDDLGWLCDRVDDDTAAGLGPDAAPAVRVLRASAQLLRGGDPGDRDRQRAELTAAIEDMRTVAFSGYRTDIEQMLRAGDDDEAAQVGRQLLDRRTVNAQVAVVGRLIAGAAAADARPLLARVLGRGLPPTQAAVRVQSETQAVTRIPSGHLAARSVAVRNSLRTGLGLALAVAVTQLFPVEHGFWVVLAAMSVLRNTALSTGTNVVRAIVGTTLGFALGAALIALIGVNPAVLWLLLPIASFLAAFVPKLWSFTAGQAAFTMQVLIVFNLIQPSGWQVGLLRIENILVGGLVAATVSLLLWPRGSGNALHRALDAEVSASLDYLNAAVDRITTDSADRSASDPTVAELGGRALAAARIVDDSARQFLSEGGGRPERPTPVVREINRVAKLRAAADLIADVPEPPSAGAYPRTRAILGAEAEQLCAQMRGHDGPPVQRQLLDELVPTLRSEAPSVADPVSDALPLITVAANLGELTELYSLS